MTRGLVAQRLNRQLSAAAKGGNGAGPGGASSIPDDGTSSLGAWFLGPKAENEHLLADLVLHAIREHSKDRCAYYPDDPGWITDEIRQTEAYKHGVRTLAGHFKELVQQLKGSAPFFSYRYQAHMLWDQTLPGILGYFAALLYNQNNVAAEASPVTTMLEIAAGNDLCEMLGYTLRNEAEVKRGAIAPWGHITCGGTVANAEATWAARNAKCYGLAVAAAIREEKVLAKARAMKVTLADDRVVRLVEATPWQLLNIRLDDTLALPHRLEKEHSVDKGMLDAVMRNYSVQELGLATFWQRYAASTPTPVVFGPSTMHYSWPKALALLGLGQRNLFRVPVDADARLDTDVLRSALEFALADRRPVLMAVAVIGSTEESAVDPLTEVLALREEFRAHGLDFLVHADAAWGGYFASILRKPRRSVARRRGGAEAAHETRHRPEFTDPKLVLSKHVAAQLDAMKDADSITVDPHKGGCIPYPAGALCYRNGATRGLVSLTSPVVYHGGVDPTVGVYGIEGSKPGAAAAAVYLSHRVMRPDQSGYGMLLGKSMFNSKRFYAALVTMVRKDDPFTVVPLQRLPAERAAHGADAIEAQRAFIRTRIVERTNAELLADDEAMTLFRQLGSDQNIVAYAFNFSHRGKPNRDVTLAGKLNNTIFETLSVHPPEAITRGMAPPPDTPLILTASSFDPATYGRAFVSQFRDRLGVDRENRDYAVPFLISTTLDPWVTDTAAGNFIPTLIEELRIAVLAAIAKVSQSRAPSTRSRRGTA